MMNISSSPSSWVRRAMGAGALLALTATAATSTLSAAPLRTTERVISTPFTGKQSVTCLLLDGKLLPLMPPDALKVTGSGEGLILIWPGEHAAAKFRGADAKEAALLSGDDWKKPSPAADDGWARVSAAGIAPGIENLTPARPELDVMLVNNWRTGLISRDYRLGGQSFSHLLLLCRCADGYTFAVTLDAPTADLKDCRQTLLGMIGGPILVREDELGS